MALDFAKWRAETSRELNSVSRVSVIGRGMAFSNVVRVNEREGLRGGGKRENCEEKSV